MQGDDIRYIFKTSKELIEEAYYQIQKYQKKEFIPAKTGYSYLDEAMMGGAFPQNAIAIGARPGVGKSYVGQIITGNLLNPLINPQASDYLLVNCEFEMNPMDLVTRVLSRKMGKPIRHFYDTPTSVEETKIKEILEQEKRNNIVYIPKPCSVADFNRAMIHILSKNSKKKLIIVKIDHIALIKKMGGDPKRAMDDFVATINELKLAYWNVFFLVISQFNRDIEGRRSPKEHAPRMSDFYQSDGLGQLCSIMVGLTNPRRMGYEEYMSFPATWYGNLDRFKPANKKTTFRTEGLLFHHILKARQGGIESLENTIYPEVMPGFGYLYGEGGVRYINTERPPQEPKSYTLEENDEEFDDSPYD